MIAFITVFVFYLIIIAYRYIFYQQMGALFELDMIFFMWCAIFAASYGARSGKHIVFSIAYDKFPVKVKFACRVIGNIFIITTFIILLPYAYDSIRCLRISKTSLLRIPFDIIYYPFLAFVVLTIIHYAVSLIRDIKTAIHQLKGNGKIEDEELKGKTII